MFNDYIRTLENEESDDSLLEKLEEVYGEDF